MTTIEDWGFVNMASKLKSYFDSMAIIVTTREKSPQVTCRNLPLYAPHQAIGTYGSERGIN
jgi:hypothetical protein